MTSVTLNNVSKAFGSVKVLSGISLEIQDGEFVVLVGPSGCGKSTLLRTIAGLEEASGGDILIGERRVNDLAPRDRDIAMVFQSYALYPHMDVAKNMGFSLMLRNEKPEAIGKRIGEASDKLGLGALLARLPKQLSGGQRQRVAMGRAIVRKPQVFLFDEPLSNLDAKLRAQMRTEIKALHQSLKTTSIYVTHDQVEAMTMANRIVVMRDGIVEQVGAPLDLYDYPASIFVAGFIGSPTMNFVDGIVEAGRPNKVRLANGALVSAADPLRSSCIAISGIRASVRWRSTRAWSPWHVRSSGCRPTTRACASRSATGRWRSRRNAAICWWWTLSTTRRPPSTSRASVSMRPPLLRLRRRA